MRLLITTHPGRGHVYPAVAVGKMAHSRGHEVAVATGPRYERLVTDAGLRFFAAGVDWDQSAAEQPWRMIIEISPPKFVTDLLAIVKAWQPDLILREETELSAWVVADALKIPFATLGLGGLMPPRAFQGDVAARMNGLRAEVGAPADPEMSGINRFLYLDQYPRAWVPATRRPSAAYHSIGAATLADVPATLPANTAPRTPHLYATLGTVHARQPRLIQTLLDALAVLGVPATVTLGPAAENHAFSAPPTVEIFDFVPQDELLPRCSAIICHAGTGTVLGALRYGVPLVMIPVAANQGLTAQLASRAGVGLRLLGENPRQTRAPGRRADLATIDVDGVVTAVQTLLSDAAYRQKARSAGQELRERWLSGMAVHLLEQLAVMRQPVPSEA